MQFVAIAITTAGLPGLGFGQASVTLGWTPSVSTDVVGYHVYFGGASGVYTDMVTVASTTNTTISGLQPGSTYYFAATAFDPAGLESDFTPEITYTVPSPPLVALTSPVDGSRYQAPAVIPLSASVTANGHTITAVQYYNGTNLLANVGTAPYSFTWTNVGADSYSLSAVALYDADRTVSSSPVTVTVTNPLPLVALTAPASGTSYAAPADIALSANVTSNGHVITQVQFYSNGILLGQDTSTPYVFDDANVPPGSYNLNAVAVYDAGSTVTSATVTVTVTSAVPTIVLTSPAAGSTYVAPATIQLAASVLPLGHTISQVRFYNGGNYLGADTAAPYTYTWSKVKAGNYSLSAQASYEGGQKISSAPVAITVGSSQPLALSATVGTTTSPGSASSTDGVYTVSSGGNLGGTNDNFQFVYQPLGTNGSIIAQINATLPSGPDGCAGVMLRHDLSSSSAYLFIGVKGDGTPLCQIRDSDGAGSISLPCLISASPPNYWVTLSRNGDSVTAYCSADGVDWSMAQTLPLALGESIYAGLAVASGSPDTFMTSVFGNVSVFGP